MCSPCNSEVASVTRFREFLRLKCMHPDPDYTASVDFLKRQANEIGLSFKIITIIENNPIVIITWEGTDPSKKNILLNCHMDVVPVYEEYWKTDPFGAVKDKCGNIYARGSQDMRCVGMQYLEAIRVLKNQNFRPECSFHLSFVPDEEVGGIKGMRRFVKHEEFNLLNIGFSLDEGLANPTENFSVYYSERSRYVFKITFTGNAGHGSMFIENTAIEKLSNFIILVNQYRTEQKNYIAQTNGSLGDVTTMNMTMLKGGVQNNVVPSTFTMEIDCRITPNIKNSEVEQKVAAWCKLVGQGVSYDIIERFDGNNVTSRIDNIYCNAFQKGIDESQIKTTTVIFLGATDSRYLREINIPAIGFSPMNNTPILLHDHNEFLNENVFTRGIEIYCNIIKSLAVC